MDEIVVQPDPQSITADEFEELCALTIRYRHDTRAIFSANSEGRLWASTRNGKTPENERVDLDGVLYILDQLKRSLLHRRWEGGRLFVDHDGAYWKKGSAGGVGKVRFVKWYWKGDPPLRIEAKEQSRQEMIARVLGKRNHKETR